MPANYSVQTEITGKGNLAAFAERAAKAVSGIVSPLKAVSEAASKPNTTALGRVGIAADNVAGKFRGGLGSITAWLPALGALGAAASLGGLIAMTRKSAEGMEGINLAAEKLGMPIAQLAEYRYGWKLTNVETEAGEKAMGKLNKTIYDAATGKNKDAAALFARLGISLRDANGHVRKASDVLPLLAQGFKNNEDASLRAAMAQALFGKAGQELIPWLAKGKDGLEDISAENKKYGKLNDEQNKSLGDLAENYKHLDKAGDKLSQRLSASMAPALNRVVQATTNWIVANREVIGQSLDRKIAKVTSAVEFVSGAFAGLLAIPWIAEMTKGANASDVFDVALGVLGVAMAGPVLSALQMVTMAVIRMNAAMLLNPVVLVIAAIAAAAYAIYANWGPITEWFNNQMAAIRSAFDQGWGSGLWEIFKRFNPQTLIMTAINGLVKWLFGIDLFDAGSKLMQRLIDGIKSLLPDLQPIFDKIDKVVTWAGGASSSIAAAAAAEGGGSFDPGGGYAATTIPGPSPAATAQAAPPSEVKVKVDFANVPKGADVSTTSRGPASVSQNVGYSMAGDNT